MIFFLFVMAAFFLGFGLNAALDIKDAISSISVGVAIFAAYLTHLFSKSRDRVKEYESVYSLMCGICNASGEISDIVKSSKKEEIDGKKPFAIMPSTEIYTVCSQELLNVYKEDVYRISSNRLFDPDSVVAVLKFKLHFNLFVEYVSRYMNMSSNIDEGTKCYLEHLMGEYNSLLSNGLLEKADDIMKKRNECAMNCFNGFCYPILTQYRLMIEQRDKVSNGMKKAKEFFF